MSYQSKPYREGYKHDIRKLAFQYGVTALATAQLNYKVFHIEPFAIPVKAKKLVQRNIFRARKLRKMIILHRIRANRPVTPLPLP